MSRFLLPALRTFLAFSIPFLLVFPAQAQRYKEVQAKVKEVTVFLQRAQVSSSASTNIGAGQTELALVNVPSNLDVSSIQVEAQGKAILLGIRYENNYLQENEKPREVRQIEDSLENYVNRIRTITDQNEVYRKEENMVVANQSIGGQKGVSVDDLEEVADFFRKRLFAIRANILKNEILLKILNERAEKLRSQQAEISSRSDLPTGRIIVAVSAENATPLALELSYVVYNAGWQPVYDLRATNTKSPVKLQYKANVFQNTGVNWNNVKLTLATSNPSIGATKPELQPWYLNFLEVVRSAVSAKQLYGRPAAKAPAAAYESAADDGESLEEAGSIADYTVAAEGALAVNFKIGIPYSVPADGKMHLVDIQQYDMPATYTFSAVPKLTPDAFLMAQLTGWDEYNILPGVANVFLEGTFTGKTMLNPRATGDTLHVSLGRDKRIVITREKVKELKSKSLLGNTRKETRSFLISVRNTKNETVILTLEDQIPVSNNKDIEVDEEELSGGNLDHDTGKITWKLKLNPNETKKIPLKFSVKYPKNQVVPGL